MTQGEPGTSGARSVLRDRKISDAVTMRALAHPVRIALLEALTREGPLTATRAAELLGDSPGNMSWHLQTLAKYGFVEEAGGGRGRSRPWRVVEVSHSFDPAMADPEHAAAGEALERSLQQRNDERLREWWSQRALYPEQWRRAAFSSYFVSYLTADEMKQLNEDIIELLSRFVARITDRSLRPPGAQPVDLVAFGHPVPPTSSGN